MRRMTDLKAQKQTFEDMADKRASKAVQAAQFEGPEVRPTNHPLTSRGGPGVHKQKQLLQLDEDYFKQKTNPSGSMPGIEEVKSQFKQQTPDEAYAALKDQYLNYRSSSQPSRDFIQDST